MLLDTGFGKEIITGSSGVSGLSSVIAMYQVAQMAPEHGPLLVVIFAS